MRKLISILVAALFAAVTFSAYAADTTTQGDTTKSTKQAKKKKKSKSSASSGSVQQGAPASSGRGDPSGAASGGAIKEGAPAAQGRADPSGAAAKGGGAATTAPSTGAGRSDNK